MDNEIQMLMPGEAVITSPRTPFALPVMIHLYEDYLDQTGNNVHEGDKKDGTEIEKPGGKVDDNFF
jgi:hypothetical protein